MCASTTNTNNVKMIIFRHERILAAKNTKAYISVGFDIMTKCRQYYLFENWYLFLAPERPGFFLSTSRGSLVRNPAALSSGRSPG